MPSQRLPVNAQSVSWQLPMRTLQQTPGTLQSKLGYGSVLLPPGTVHAAVPAAQFGINTKPRMVSDNTLGCSVSTVASSDYCLGVNRSRASTFDQSELCRSRTSTLGDLSERSMASVSEGVESPNKSSDANANKVSMPRSIGGDCVLKVGAHTLQGTKGEHNQDTHLVLPIGQSRMLVGVFDGHGSHGHVAAARVRDIFAQMAPHLIPKAQAPLLDEVSDAILRQLFQIAHSALARDLDSSGQPMAAYSGATATAAIIDMDSGTMSCAHVGDSALLLSSAGNVQFLTQDHIVDEAAEQRVRMHGGEVREELVGGITARRIFARGQRLPGIMMDRSLGDLVGHQLGMLSTPDVVTGLQVGPGSMVILASDGVWEHQRTQQVLAHAEHSDAQQSAKNLVELSRAGCASNPLIDDITAVVVMVEPKHLSCKV